MVEFLMGTDWMPRLPPAAQDRVLADAWEKVYAPKEMVAHRGQAATSWVGVVDGLLKVSTSTNAGRPVIFTAVPPRSWIGEGAVIKGELRRYDLQAFRRSRLVHVPRDTLMWLLETDLPFCRHLIDYLNERTGQFVAMMEMSRAEDPAQKIAAAVSILCNRILYPKVGSLLQLSQSELGELAGLSRPTTNAALRKLVRLGILQTEYGGVRIPDSQRLVEFLANMDRQ